MKLKIAAIFPLCAVLAGCLVNTQSGRGPLTLSPQVEEAYQRYLETETPLAFAVSTDGQWASYVYCPDRGPCIGGERAKAVEYCERSGKTCHIYDHMGRILWRTDLPPLPES
ncbi:hypothetical protein [Marinimicrococcus flavescens]|uniref:Lipoprotein n=1 Tax=Marinimicrococcus flavescens TaxID=3031815 RepID=A0AAP3XQX1_9PROT|nr:hypothetical protein [Marinimicrococcus flavescens]